MNGYVSARTEPLQPGVYPQPDDSVDLAFESVLTGSPVFTASLTRKELRYLWYRIEDVLNRRDDRVDVAEPEDEDADADDDYDADEIAEREQGFVSILNVVAVGETIYNCLGAPFTVMAKVDDTTAVVKRPGASQGQRAAFPGMWKNQNGAPILLVLAPGD